MRIHPVHLWLAQPASIRLEKELHVQLARPVLDAMPSVRRPCVFQVTSAQTPCRRRKSRLSLDKWRPRQVWRQSTVRQAHIQLKVTLASDARLIHSAHRPHTRLSRVLSALTLRLLEPLHAQCVQPDLDVLRQAPVQFCACQAPLQLIRAQLPALTVPWAQAVQIHQLLQ
jgi:hypothetical protein